MTEEEQKEGLIIEVAPDGAPAVRFLDENGRETGRIPAETGKS